MSWWLNFHLNCGQPLFTNIHSRRKQKNQERVIFSEIENRRIQETLSPRLSKNPRKLTPANSNASILENTQ